MRRVLAVSRQYSTDTATGKSRRKARRPRHPLQQNAAGDAEVSAVVVSAVGVEAGAAKAEAQAHARRPWSR